MTLALLCVALNDIYRIHAISFIPANKPVTVKAGGEVVHRATLCKFEELLHPQFGMLGFTVMPILQEEFSPPQVLYIVLSISFFSFYICIREYYLIFE